MWLPGATVGTERATEEESREDDEDEAGPPGVYCADLLLSACMHAWSDLMRLTAPSCLKGCQHMRNHRTAYPHTTIDFTTSI